MPKPLDWDALDTFCTPEFAAQALEVSVDTIRRYLADPAHPLIGRRFAPQGNWHVLTASLRALWQEGYRGERTE